MDGFVVLATTKEDGERFLLVETRRRVVGCPTCGVIATGHGRSVVQVRDLPTSGGLVRLVWRKRRWLCGDPDCEARSRFLAMVEKRRRNSACRAGEV
ncbi:MAG TPA: transposase family protein [Acidimicrobiales bacterium]|nr:transposase family protein [Acidimicrobiales bacterium]